MFRRLLTAIRAFFWKPRPGQPVYLPLPGPAKAPKYSETVVLEHPPRPDLVADTSIYVVCRSGKDRWAIFRCPCGCSVVITLSLQSVHRPYWQATRTPSGRSSLFPSVWRDQGCLSHFVVSDGLVLWEHDTGNAPPYR